jgi:hypothetical protein
MFGKISPATIMKSEVVVSKKTLFTDKSTLSQLKSPSTSPLLPLTMEQLQFSTNKFDSFTKMSNQKAKEVDSLLSNIQ